MPSWEYSASMSLHAAARAVTHPPFRKSTTPTALKELRNVVQIFHDGNEVYRCIFVPPADY